MGNLSFKQTLKRVLKQKHQTPDSKSTPDQKGLTQKQAEPKTKETSSKVKNGALGEQKAGMAMQVNQGLLLFIEKDGGYLLNVQTRKLSSERHQDKPLLVSAWNISSLSSVRQREQAQYMLLS